MKMNFQQVMNWRFTPDSGNIEELLNSKKLTLWGDNFRTFGDLGRVSALCEEQGNIIAKMEDGNTYLLTRKNMQKYQRNSFSNWHRKVKTWS